MDSPIHTTSVASFLHSPLHSPLAAAPSSPLPAPDVPMWMIMPTHTYLRSPAPAPLAILAPLPLTCTRVGRQHVLHLAGADAKGECAEGTMGGGVGVAADNDRAGQGEALMGGRKGEGVSQGRGNRIRVR